ncbi:MULTISPECIES: NAD(P)H-dependent oxidoreductase [Aneurinibacillus]|uniref:NAD(P)H dehydrogenase (Quinone) n=1 Tax=Aneurinibacillus thermoaerophilus TaxID=143495 RepID=A0A1G8A7N4_ANETH|nr:MULTISPECIES: NAD(P)H-dependent oxidoreductase [Aneurinibacillus]AMA74072.1 hypothetical protein ACH33_15430 [Aneurinibacillus sp. XH2]MED0675444.1 NAD(P)H-dependent oxidoreductase [Aneurinibacillus thermoaerophilus]MED0678798.1 NAD(P)H-dependent oxidoreductase [Aneurinibacillus thermoaerophilus]MED0736672.1 NAD(P)H-dependent oxidoreductase [Aneurinibacillus thermoaerophilus]MED0758326.1 NAD(P)H-dependent oxidoreductase [Aneurinibacillus thermoaerophilus]
MKALLLFAHPNNQDSFNSAIRDEVQKALESKGVETRIRDLYAANFQPVLTTDEMALWERGEVPEDIVEEQKHIKWADLLVIIYPVWWAGPPAILKGYYDRVLTSGFAYQYTENGHEKLLGAKKALVIETASATKESLQKRSLDSAFKAAVDVGILDYCGIQVMEHLILDNIHHVSDDERKQMLARIKETVSKLYINHN